MREMMEMMQMAHVSSEERQAQLDLAAATVDKLERDLRLKTQLLERIRNRITLLDSWTADMSAIQDASNQLTVDKLHRVCVTLFSVF